MNTKLLLNEALYNLGHPVDEIYRNIIFPWIVRARKGEKNLKNSYDITEYVYQTIKKITSNVPTKMTLFLRDSSRSTEQTYENITPAGKKSKIGLNITKKDLAKDSVQDLKKYFIEYLTHELTHAIDKLRMGETSFKAPNLDSDYQYVKDVAETNAYVNQIISIAKKDKKAWNSIKNIEDLTKYLNKKGTLGNIFKNIKEKNPNGFKVLMKTVLKRLAREKMLPKGMITS